jgi:NAD(P)H-nitrite reductase large subunit
MKSYTYLIVGGGMAADAAVTGIRSVDDKGTIGLIGAEPDAPYDRPPLSKALWKDGSVESIGRKTADKAVTLHLGRTVGALEPKATKNC